MKNKILILAALVICFCFVSCQKKEETSINVIGLKDVNKQNLVPKSIALQLARSMSNDLFLNKSRKNTAAKPTTDSNLVQLRDVENSFTIPDSDGEPALYVINYRNDSGFIVISADYRFQPVCAYTDNGHINETDTIPPAFGSWLGRTVEDIEMIRNATYDNDINGYHEWERWDSLITMLGFVNLEFHIPDPPDPCIEPVTPITVGPLLGNLAWGQGPGFNDLCPNGNCNTTTNGHVWAGCVAVAMAQVIKYWQYPSGFNYSSMPDANGNVYVQDLIHRAGLSVNMNWGCNGSGANDNSIPGALQSTFNYSTATRVNHFDLFDRPVIVGDLDNSKPVLLGGFENHINLWLFRIPYNGHEWVCDGYNQSGWSVCYKQVWFHMNWGWNGSYNTWCYWDDWNVSGQNFQYAQSYIYNIHP